MPTPARWYRQPVLWLGAVLFAAVVAGGVITVMVASRYADEPLPMASEQVFKVPATRPVTP